MAKNNSTPPRDLVDHGDTVSLSKPRQLVALEAAWEIEQLCILVRTTLDNGGDIGDFASRGISVRIEQLSQIIMQALHDEVDTSELAYSLRLRHEELTA